jgi:hypothetical protein
MARHRGLATIGALLLVIGLATGPGHAVVEGPQMVGVGLPPDSVAQNPDRDHCAYTTDWDSLPGFSFWRHEDPVINRDVELFISLTLSGPYQVTDDEAAELLEAVARDTSNAFDVDEKDVQLITNYLSCLGGYDPQYGFEVFPTCGPEVPADDDRDHMDFYLVKWGYGDDITYGAWRSGFTDTLEDEPRQAGAPTFIWNSFHVTDAHGNELDDPS